MPLVVTDRLWIVVLKLHGPAADAGHQVKVTGHQLDRQEVGTPTRVVYQQPGGLPRAKGKPQTEV